MIKQTEIQDNHVKILLEHYKSNKLALAHLAMRYGKTRLSCELFKKLLPGHATIVIAYPDNKLKDSWIQECVKWDYNNPNITYVNFSSLWKYEDKIFDMVVCDEIHALSPNELDIFHRLITNDKNTYVLGLSGTISKETQGKIGIPIVIEYLTDEGIDSSILADYSITVHWVELDKTVKFPNKKGKLLTEKQKYDNYTFIINKFKEEGKDTMFLALNRNRLSTSSLGKINYAKKLLGKLKDKRVIIFAGLTDTADTLNIPSYHNKSKNDQNFQDFQNKKINHLALASMGKLGVSYVDLDCVILLNATGNPEETAQIINRAIKLDYTNKIADTHILALNEPAEKKKMIKSLSMLNKLKIKYI